MSDIRETIELCRKSLIYPVCSFIFLNPYSTLEDIKYNLKECYNLRLLDFIPASLNILRPERESKIYKMLEKDDLLFWDKDVIKLKWIDKHVEILAGIFENMYYGIEVWRRFLLLSELHQLVYELEFLGVRSKGRNIIESINIIFVELNQYNYEFLIELINDVESMDKSLIKKDLKIICMFWIVTIVPSLKYYTKIYVKKLR